MKGKKKSVENGGGKGGVRTKSETESKSHS